jgi:hypothetical protein
MINFSHGEERIQNKLIKELHQDWQIETLLNDEANSTRAEFRLVGAPDGIGVLRKNNFLISIFINHEISNDQGVVRSHGGKGAFVSEWIFDIRSKKIITGRDLIKKIKLWDRDRNMFVEENNLSIHRLCSGDLPDQSAFFNIKTMKGFKGRIF